MEEEVSRTQLMRQMEALPRCLAGMEPPEGADTTAPSPTVAPAFHRSAAPSPEPPAVAAYHWAAATASLTSTSIRA